MITNPQLWWHLSRASGIVSWVLLTTSVLWGLLLSTRVLRDMDRPAWLLDLHRWLGTLTWATTAVHLGTLVADSYVEFTAADLLVPMSSSWKPGAVAWGIVGMYLILVVQVTSRFMKKLPRAVWHSIHLLSYPSFLLVSVHAFAAGTDAGSNYFLILGTSLLSLVALMTTARILLHLNSSRSHERRRRGTSQPANA